MASGPTVVWIGRLQPDGAADQERLLAELRQPDNIRRLRENYHLATYRVEAKDDEVRVTMAGTEPPAIPAFLKAHRFWPRAWQYVGNGRPEPPGAGGRRVLFDLADH
jgi:hypothetical protein